MIPARSIASACCAVLLGMAPLTACGSDGDEISDADLAKALLVADDLSDEFRISDDDDDDSDEASWGCPP